MMEVTGFLWLFSGIRRNFNHPNILKVLGVCVDNDPVYIILELMPGGDLLKFLRKAKMDHVSIYTQVCSYRA